MNIAWPSYGLSLKNFDFSKPDKNIVQEKEVVPKIIPSVNSNKQKLLDELKLEINNIDDIQFKFCAQNLVFSHGNIDSKVMLIGEAPGEEEDKQGIPFVGRSGKLLSLFLETSGFDRSNYYITNVIPWRPPGNRTPSKEEIEIMKPFVLKHIEIIQPEIIVTVGATALKTLYGDCVISKLQGTFLDFGKFKIYPIFHPSYALRVPVKKKELWFSILKLKKTWDALI